jgi:hypothetical protein
MASAWGKEGHPQTGRDLLFQIIDPNGLGGAIQQAGQHRQAGCDLG